MKSTMTTLRLFVSFLLLISAVACFAAGELSIGATAPKFSLVNAVDGKTVAFHPGDGKLSVVVFTCNQCPFAKAFEPRIIELAKQYQAKGVAFYAIDPNDDAQNSIESLPEMKARATEHGYSFPYLKDGDSAIARAYGARVTPHVYVIDGGGTLRYRGYVDDSAKPEERRTTGLTNALDDLLAGKTVSNQSTRAFGCTIKFKS
jgi:Peroxiredoxin